MLLLIVPHICQYADKRGQVQKQVRATDEAIGGNPDAAMSSAITASGGIDHARIRLTAQLNSLRSSEATRTREASAMHSSQAWGWRGTVPKASPRKGT